MERESNPEPHHLALVGGSLACGDKRIPVLGLVILMLMPWVWVTLGLYVFKDYRLTIILYELLGCLLPILLFKPRDLPVFPIRLKKSILIIAMILMNIAILSCFKLTDGFHMDGRYFHEQSQRVQLAINPQFWLFAAYIVILNPLFEEGFWRGIIYTQWKNYISPPAAMVLSSIFFGGWHWLVLNHFCPPLWALGLTVMVMAGGILFAQTYEKTGTLGAAIMLHGLGTDFPLVFVVYDSILYHAVTTSTMM